MPTAAPRADVACRASPDGRPHRPQSKPGHRPRRPGKPTGSVRRSSPLPSCVLQMAPLSPAQAATTTRSRPQLRPQDRIRSQTPDRRPFAGARHPLRPHSARSSSAGHRWPAARHASWLTLITSSGRHIMRRSMRQAPSAASTRPPRRTAAVCAFSLTSRITQRERRSPLASAAPRLRKINSAQRPSAAGRATAGSASCSAAGAGPSLATRSPSVIPASASALAPAVKRTMSMLCYGRAPAVRQPAWYPVRAAAE